MILFDGYKGQYYCIYKDMKVEHDCPSECKCSPEQD